MKNIVITGISRGIGKSLGNIFQKEGKVIGISRTKPSLENIHWIEADITQYDTMQKVKKQILEEFGPVHVLINNAGMGLYGTWEETPVEDLKKVFELNFFSVVNMTRLFLPDLKKTKGSIINVSSVAGKFHVPCMGGYCATKYAINAFSDSLRVELHPYQVHVLNLIVGRINTGFSEHALGTRTPPHTPGAGSAEKLAKKVYLAYKKNKKEIIYPHWYSFFMMIPRNFHSFYDAINIKKWGLNKNQ